VIVLLPLQVDTFWIAGGAMEALNELGRGLVGCSSVELSTTPLLWAKPKRP